MGRGTGKVSGGRAWVLAGAGALGLVWLSGCAKPLLSPDEPRTQFDRYDAARNQQAEQYQMDEWGRRRPNLRERLLPRN